MKSLIYKILLFIVVLIGLNYLYKITFYEHDLHESSPVIDQCRKINYHKNDIVYVGESSNDSHYLYDIDKRFLSDFIADYYPSHNMGDITYHSYHAEAYYHILNNCTDNDNIETVIVTMNLRSFGPRWIHSKLETYLQKNLVMLKKYPAAIDRFLLALKSYDIKTDQEREKQIQEHWDNDLILLPIEQKHTTETEWEKNIPEEGLRNPDGKIDGGKRELAKHYLKNFAFEIDTLTNPRVRDFDKIVELAKRQGWNLVFNLMAENVDEAKYAGEDLLKLMENNRNILINRYNRDGVIVVDNLKTVRADDFYDYWATEHYAERGRKEVARKVAEAMRVLYPSDFAVPEYKYEKPRHFFNDCEKENLWEENHTLSFEQHYSGLRSSKTGDGKKSSVRIFYPVSQLPDSLKSITVTAMVYQEKPNTNAALSIEISGKNVKYQLIGKDINDVAKDSKKWYKIEHRVKLDSSFYKADNLKIFLYNKSNDIVYIDDIDIKLE